MICYIQLISLRWTKSEHSIVYIEVFVCAIKRYDGLTPSSNCSGCKDFKVVELSKQIDVSLSLCVCMFVCFRTWQCFVYNNHWHIIHVLQPPYSHFYSSFLLFKIKHKALLPVAKSFIIITHYLVLFHTYSCFMSCMVPYLVAYHNGSFNIHWQRNELNFTYTSVSKWQTILYSYSPFIFQQLFRYVFLNSS